MEKKVQFLLDFVSNCQNTCYITTDSDTMNQIPSILGESYCLIDLKDDYSPLRPFMELLRFYNPPFKMLQSQVYPLQLETFATYIHDGIAKEREDIVLDHEINYEKKQIKNTLVSLIEKLNGDNNYIFLNSQFMNMDSLEIVTEVEKSAHKGKFIFCFDSENPYTAKKTVMTFLKDISQNHNYLTGFKLEKKYGKDLSEDFSFTYESLIMALRNARLFLDLKQAAFLADKALEILETQKNYSPLARELKLEVALAYFICSEADKSAVLLSAISDEGIDDEIDLKTKLFLSKIYNSKSMLNLAKKYALLILQRFSDGRNKKSPYYALALMQDYFSTSRDDRVLALDKYKAAIDALLRSDLNNNFVNTVLHFPEVVFEDENQLGFFEYLLDKTDRISHEIENNMQISAVMHWRAIYFEETGHNDEARKALEKADALRTQLGDIKQMICIKNGLSDFCMRMARFKEAYNVLNDFTDQLFLVSDYILIIELLKNMSRATFYVHNFELTEKIALVLLDLYKKFVPENISLNSYIPKPEDIYSFQSVIDIYNKDYFHAEMNYKILTSKTAKLSDNCKPFIFYVDACLKAVKGEYEAAEKLMAKVIEDYNKLGKYSHTIVFLLYDFAIHLENLGNHQLSQKYFDIGFNLAREKSLVYFFKNKKEYTLEEYRNSFTKLADFKIDSLMLIDKANKDYSINQLHNKLNEYQFINKINSFNPGITGIKNYLEKISFCICEFLAAQSVSFAQLGISKKWKNLTSFSQSSTKEMLLPEAVWENLFERYGSPEKPELIFDKDNELYYCDLSKFDFKGAIVILPNDSKKFSSLAVSIVNIALLNIQSQLLIYTQHENLAALTAIDPITGLSNRRALSRHLTLENERVERFFKRKKQIIQKAIAFIDIDNFKYYNERFGYIAGDFLLKCFADILKNTLRRIDFVCRYGGDEFVVVMGDTSEDEGERMCQRIYIELSKRDFFLPDLKHFISQDFDIPQNKAIGFSMGLCCNSDTAEPANLMEVLRNANKALKFAKENGKGSVATWSKIKDLADLRP